MLSNKKFKQVWFEDELWDVHEIISPNKYDDFIVLKRKSKDTIHDNGKTIPVEMWLIDCHNNTWYPNTPKINQLMQKAKSMNKKNEDKVYELKELLEEELEKAMPYLDP